MQGIQFKQKKTAVLFDHPQIPDVSDFLLHANAEGYGFKIDTIMNYCQLLCAIRITMRVFSAWPFSKLETTRTTWLSCDSGEKRTHRWKVLNNFILFVFKLYLDTALSLTINKNLKHLSKLSLTKKERQRYLNFRKQEHFVFAWFLFSNVFVLTLAVVI